MSKSKIRRPAKNTPAPAQTPPAQQIIPLDDSPESLVVEWRRLQGLIAEINVQLKTNQQKMAEIEESNKNLQNQGLQIMGAASSISRLLAGKGVDPATYSLPNAAPEDEDSFEEEAPEMARGPYPVDEPEVNENPRSSVLRRRFR